MPVLSSLLMFRSIAIKKGVQTKSKAEMVGHLDGLVQETSSLGQLKYYHLKSGRRHSKIFTEQPLVLILSLFWFFGSHLNLSLVNDMGF